MRTTLPTRPIRATMVVPVMALVLFGAGCAHTGGPPTGSTSGGIVATEIEFDTSGDTPVVAVSFNDYGEGGVRGVDSATVYGDGRVVRTRPDGVTTEVLDIGPLGVRDLLVRADELDLLGPPDFGDMAVADAGSGTIELRFNNRTVEMQIDGPFSTGRTDIPQNKARAAFGTFLRQTLTLSDVTIIDGPTVVVPDKLEVRGNPVSDESEPIDWPLSRPPSEVFADGATVTLTGEDVQAIVDALSNESDLERRNGTVALAVSTGEKAPEQLTLWVGTGQSGPGAMVPETADPEAVPWPADNRRDATAWESWQAAAAVTEAADSSKLPLGDPGYLQAYEFAFSVGTVDGGTVIDVVATPDSDHRGRDDIPPFVARVDPDGLDGATVTRVHA